MTLDLTRRGFLLASGALAAAPLPATTAPFLAKAAPKFTLGTISYNIGSTWDLATLLSACKTTGFGCVELRTSHAHKVEPDLTADQRRDVKKQIEDSGVRLWGFGSVCEFHAADPAV